MSYGLLAQFTFLTQGEKLPSSRRSLKRVQFFKRGYTGQPIEILNGNKAPLSDREQADSDSRFVGLIPKEISFGFLDVASQTEARQFLVRDERDIQVRVDEVNNSGDILENNFRGWLLNSDLQVPYAPKPYPVQLTAVCGLALLKSRPLLTTDGKYPDGNTTLRELIKGGLATIGFELPLASICNIRETQDRVTNVLTQERDTLTRLLLHAEALRKDGKPMTAYDFLEALCVSFNASLRQVNGEWVFARQNELLGGYVPASVLNPAATDTYAFAPNPVTGVLEGQIRNLVVPITFTGANRIEKNDPQFTLQQTLPVVAVGQAFGDQVSRLKNGSFANLDSNGFPTSWKKADAAFSNIMRMGNGSPADPYRMRIYGAGENQILRDAPQVVGFAQQIDFRNPDGSPSYELKDKPCTLTAQFKGETIRGAKIWVVAQFDPAPPSPITPWAMLNGDGQWVVRPSRSDLHAIEVYHFQEQEQNATAFTKSGLGEISITLPAQLFNVVGLTLFFCQGNYLRKPGFGDIISSTPEHTYIDYYEPKLLIGDPQKKLQGQTKIIRNYSNLDNDSVLEEVPAADPVMLYGDLPAAIGIATTHALLTTTPSAVLVPAYRFDRPRRDALLGTGKELVLINALERAAQVARPAMLLDCTILGRLPYGSLSILHLMDQSGQDGTTSYFQITSYEYNMRADTYKISALEILRENTPEAITGTWQTPDGDLPQEIDPNVTVDPDFDVIPDPVTPNPKTKVGQPTPDELIKSIRDKSITPIFEINSGVLPNDLPDTLPPTSAQKADMGRIHFFIGQTEIASSLATGRELFTFYETLDQP